MQEQWPKVVRDMERERHGGGAEGAWRLFVTCCMVAAVVAVALVASGCAVSLSFEPAWKLEKEAK